VDRKNSQNKKNKKLRLMKLMTEGRGVWSTMWGMQWKRGTNFPCPGEKIDTTHLKGKGKKGQERQRRGYGCVERIPSMGKGKHFLGRQGDAKERGAVAIGRGPRMEFSRTIDQIRRGHIRSAPENICEHEFLNVGRKKR